MRRAPMTPRIGHGGHNGGGPNLNGLPDGSENAHAEVDQEVNNAGRAVYEATMSRLVQTLVQTGDPKLDFVVLVSIPIALQSLIYFGRQSINYALDSYHSWRSGDDAVRVIKLHNRAYGSDHRNDILIKALNIYVAELLNERKVDLKYADVQLNSVDGTVEQMRAQSYRARYGDPYGGSSGGQNDGDNSEYAQLKRLSVMSTPSPNMFINLGNDIFLLRDERERNVDLGDSRGGHTEVDVEYILRSKNPGGTERIDSFLKQVYNTYVGKMAHVNDNGRYLYKMVKSTGSTGGGGGGGGGMGFPRYHGGGSMDNSSSSGLRYKRYLLSDQKTFGNLFFPEKANLLKLVDHFRDKTGKYAISGYPDKLGLLLFGPPGTGKTSLIKALAHYTGRHIVKIELSKIETNEQLFDAIYDRSFCVPDHPFPVKLDYKDVIFVLEEIDTSSDVVFKRDGDDVNAAAKIIGKDKDKTAAASAKSAPKKKPDAASAAAAISAAAAASSSPRSLGGDDADAVTASESTAEADGKDAKKKEKESIAEEYRKQVKEFQDAKDKKDDKLNLGELLNVLDGIVDTPGRMVIMTSNHPDVLDSALIRPGRIDKLIYLGYMRAKEAKDLLELYFQTEVTPEQMARLEALLGTGLGAMDPGSAGGISPCDVEQKCSEVDSIDELLDALSPSAVVDVVVASGSSEAADSEAPQTSLAVNGRTLSIVNDEGARVALALPDEEEQRQRAKADISGRLCLPNRQFGAAASPGFLGGSSPRWQPIPVSSSGRSQSMPAQKK